MIINFDKLHITNFLIFSELDYKFEGTEPLILMEGKVEGAGSVDSNGAGKSSFIEAIVWVFFDTTMRGLKKDSVINRFVGKNCLVQLEGTIDEKSFILKRYRNHDILGTGVSMYLGGKEVSFKNASDSNEYIVSLFGLDYKDFVTSILFSNKSMRFNEMSASECISVFEKVLDLEKYSKARELIKPRMQRKKTLLDKVRGDINTLKSDNREKVEKIESIERSIESFNETKSKNLAKLEEEKALIYEESKKLDLVKLEERKEVVESSISDIDSKNVLRAEKFHSQFQERSSEYESSRTEIWKKKEEFLNTPKDSGTLLEERLLEEKLTLQKEVVCGVQYASSLHKECVDYLKESENEMRELETSKKLLIVEIRSLKSGLECATCNRPFEGTDKKSQIEKKEIELSTTQKKLDELEVNMSEAKTHIDAEKSKVLTLLKAEIEVLEDVINKEKSRSRDSITLNLATFDNSLKVLEDQYKLKEEEFLKQARESQKESVDVREEFKAELSKLKEDITKQKFLIEECSRLEGAYKIKQESTHPQLSLVSYLQEEVSKVSAKVEVLLSTLSNQEKVFTRLKEIDTLLSPKGIPSIVVDSIVDFMNERASYYSEEFTNSLLVVNFTTTKQLKSGESRDEIGIEVSSSFGGGSYDSCSEGERKRADLIIQFVLDDVRSLRGRYNFNVRFYDELLDSLDTAGTQSVLRAIKGLNQGRTVYIVSHNNTLSSLVNSKILFRKTGKFTKLELPH